ncbi:MAG: hypothetical protein DI551_01955 [Micavibrio aeruginosavorus]|uniref:Thioredoxin domain-containing protein n=1 Tax=Micavibrio aeruginosavorus TaxID=349221 RepID=A0A2W5N4D2_9BACT|nr:MAG: hypothetical protein DI551_01955 [Micavibrio aeruginosavorus]
MIRNATLLALVLAACFAYVAVENKTSAPITQKTVQGPAQQSRPAPDFSFTDFKGKKQSLSDYMGKAVVLNFWASWCAPCVIEFPQMLELAKATEGSAVFLFISLDISQRDAEKFLKKYQKDIDRKSILIGLDEDKRISQELYQTYAIPETYLIDRSGTITEKIIGADIQWNGEEMKKKIISLSH